MGDPLVFYGFMPSIDFFGCLQFLFACVRIQSIRIGSFTIEIVNPKWQKKCNVIISDDNDSHWLTEWLSEWLNDWRSTESMFAATIHCHHQHYVCVCWIPIFHYRIWKNMCTNVSVRLFRPNVFCVCVSLNHINDNGDNPFYFACCCLYDWFDFVFNQNSIETLFTIYVQQNNWLKLFLSYFF